MRASRKEFGVVVATFLIAFILAALPMPSFASPWRPAWVPMLIMYWCMMLPERVGIFSCWLLGLLLDVLKGSLLGQHAFGMTFIAFITLQNHQRLRLFPLFQQALLFVGPTLFLYTLFTLAVRVWITGTKSLAPEHSVYWYPVLSSMILWPWLVIILRDIRRARLNQKIS